jgi:hypothetical protein
MVVRAITFKSTCICRDRRLNVLTCEVLANEWQPLITLLLDDMSLFSYV